MKTKYLLVVACMAVSLFMVACKPDPKASQEYKDLKAELDKYRATDSLEAAAKELYNKVIAINDTNELDQYDALVTPDFKFHGMPDGKPGDLKAMKELFHMYYTSIPGVEMTIQHQAISGDILIAHITMSGVNSGPMGPEMPATGKSMSIEGYDCVRIQGGKMAEYWGLVDEMDMMTQLGLMPAEGEM